jgi:anti-sigma regulatory factor (Ser/Thr protein kinase)
MGVYLIKRLMDEVDYRVDDGRNVLTLTKRIRRATCL